ncbi:MAG: toll/interleukin-1 receptor domain-containing protein [Pseudomonadota bacterium]
MISVDIPPQPILSQQANPQDEVGVEKPRATAFLTYAHSDDRYVFEVNEALKLAGVKTYLDREFLETGNIQNQIIATLKVVEYQIIFCTEASSESEWCQNEVHFAGLRGIKQIPVIIDPIERMDYFQFIRLDLHRAIFVERFRHSEPAILGITRDLMRIIDGV